LIGFEIVNFRVVTGGEDRPSGRRDVWYVERRADDGRLGIVGCLYERKADADAVSKRLNDEQPNSLLNVQTEPLDDTLA
jgi:hypothetical protein